MRDSCVRRSPLLAPETIVLSERNQTDETKMARGKARRAGKAPMGLLSSEGRVRMRPLVCIRREWDYPGRGSGLVRIARTCESPVLSRQVADTLLLDRGVDGRRRLNACTVGCRPPYT